MFLYGCQVPWESKDVDSVWEDKRLGWGGGWIPFLKQGPRAVTKNLTPGPRDGCLGVGVGIEAAKVGKTQLQRQPEVLYKEVAFNAPHSSGL